jgi:hypothetical protein
MTSATLDRFRTFLTHLEAQTDKDFTIYILCNELYGKKGHDANVYAMRTISESFDLDVRYSDPKKYTYEIEARIDNDDIVSTRYVERVRQIFNATYTDTFVINPTPIKLDIKTGKYYEHEQEYNYEGTSMFVVLCQKGDKKHYVYDRPHIVMAKEVGAVVMMEAGHTFLVCHEANQLSKITGKEKEWLPQ